MDTYPYGYYSIAYLFLYQMSPNKSELERFARFAMYFAYVKLLFIASRIA